MKRFYAIFFLLTFFSCETKTQNSEKKSLSVVETAEITTSNLPTFNFNDFEFLLHKQDEMVYVVNFWATWCVPCIKELPYFEKVNKAYADKNVKVLLVSLDMPAMVETQLKPMIKKRKIASKVVVLDDPDMNTWIPKVDSDWSGAIPATLIYNKNRRQFYEQSFTLEELQKQIELFIKS